MATQPTITLCKACRAQIPNIRPGIVEYYCKPCLAVEHANRLKPRRKPDYWLPFAEVGEK